MNAKTAETPAKSAFERIREIEREITGAANLKAILEVRLKETVGESAKANLQKEKQRVETRIRIAQIEVAAIEEANFSEVARARRDAKYPPIEPAQTIFITFADDTEVALRS